MAILYLALSSDLSALAAAAGETVLVAAARHWPAQHIKLNIGLVVLSASAGAIVGQAVAAIGLAGGSASGCCALRPLHYIGLTEGSPLAAPCSVATAKVIIASRFVVLLALAGLLAGANHMPWSGSCPRSRQRRLGCALRLWRLCVGHEATHVAGPAAIAIGVIAWRRAAGGLCVRRQEHAHCAGQRKTQRNSGKECVIAVVLRRPVSLPRISQHRQSSLFAWIAPRLGRLLRASSIVHCGSEMPGRRR